MRKTLPDIRAAKKAQTPLVMLTAYSAPIAVALDQHCDILLVGDSVGMVLYGMENTLNVTLDMMIAHGAAVVRGSSHALVVVDMPFGTYEADKDTALHNARRILAETGCDAVKLEGCPETVAYLTANSVVVMGHIGLLPQSVVAEGGYKIKGKTQDDEERLIREAQAIERAGAFALVIGGTIESVSHSITLSISIPTIGIGASVACDGQVLVVDDMLGMFDRTARFVKKYADIKTYITEAANRYAQDVRNGTFPDENHVYKK